MDSGSTTSLSLLLQIRQGNECEEAWRVFVDRYGSRIFNWCLSRNLQPGDAEDVSQNVLVKLAKNLKKFEYDESGSFRGWLRRITENALADFFKEQRRIRQMHNGPSYPTLELAEAQRDLIERMEAAFDMEIFDQAIERIRVRISKNRFSAWDLMAREGLSGNEVAQRLGMKVVSVYSAKKQVQTLIQQEIGILERLADQSND